MTGRLVRAGVAYFAIVFALGFVLGTIRTLWGAQALGETRFILLEVPVMIAASWFVARWLVRRFAVRDVEAALAMGALAFAQLMAAELALATLLAGEAPGDWLASLTQVPGIYGLAGQVGFALMPLLVTTRTESG